jgi:hypothetical protein
VVDRLGHDAAVAHHMAVRAVVDVDLGVVHRPPQHPDPSVSTWRYRKPPPSGT